MLAGLAKALAMWFLTTAAAHMDLSDPPPLSPRKILTQATTSTTTLSRPSPPPPSSHAKDTFPSSDLPPVPPSRPGKPALGSLFAGGEAHGGGSCQVSLSLDEGESFIVIHSYVGGCPGQGESTLDFRVPADTPAAEQSILSWSWLNNVGNREFYQNCAVVAIESGADGGEDVFFYQRPVIFVANIEDGCKTADAADVMFPDPGPDADINNPDAAEPVGKCGWSSGAPGGALVDLSGSPRGAPAGEGLGNDLPSQGPGPQSADVATQDDPLPWVTGEAADGPSEQAIAAFVVGTALVLAVGMSLA